MQVRWDRHGPRPFHAGEGSAFQNCRSRGTSADKERGQDDGRAKVPAHEELLISSSVGFALGRSETCPTG